MSRFHVPAVAESWLPVPPGSDFPIQNLPMCRFEHDGHTSIGVRLGDWLIDVSGLANSGVLTLGARGEVTSSVRRTLFELLEASNPVLRDDAQLRDRIVIPADRGRMLIPHKPNAFIDFYSGIFHASNVGMMFRPDQPPLLPNYRHLPIGYNGRASSVVVSGTDIVRPNCQTRAQNDDLPTFGPSRELDIELEMGFFTSEATQMGTAIDIAEAEDYILGIVIVNDWSARDTQRWEYQPLGPFLSKSFGTSISPYVISLDALEPFRIDGPVQEPPVLPHLKPPRSSHYDIELEVAIQSARMSRPQTVCRSNTRHLYWSFVQQLAHQSSNGTPIEAFDLYATGTISGPDAGSFGSMLETTWRGTKPVTLVETGETRTFLEDGDEVVMRAWAERDGLRVGFGECRGRILPARPI